MVDSALDIENTLTNSLKLRVRITKEKRAAPHDENSEDYIVSLNSLYDSLDMIILLKEFTDDGNNLILLAEVLFHLTKIIIHL